jgi:hypothetical protein
MKIAAIVVIVVALFGGFKHKKKHHEVSVPPITVSSGSYTPPAYGGACPGLVPVDDTLSKRIARFGLHLRRTPPVDEPTMNHIADSIIKYAVADCIDPKLAAALIASESGFNPKAVSKTGAKGLGQMKDGTLQEMGVTDAFDIDQNLNGSLGYFKKMLALCAGNSDPVSCALASYNMGSGYVQRNGMAACQDYVDGVMKYKNMLPRCICFRKTRDTSFKNFT